MISSLKRVIRVVELGTQFLRVSSTASQAGEPDQTTHIIPPANPELCQLASPATTSGEEEPICTQHPNRSSADPKRRVPKRPNRHRTIFQKHQQSVVSKTQWNEQHTTGLQSTTTDSQKSRDKVTSPRKFRHRFSFPAVQ